MCRRPRGRERRGGSSLLGTIIRQAKSSNVSRSTFHTNRVKNRKKKLSQVSPRFFFFFHYIFHTAKYRMDLSSIALWINKSFGFEKWKTRVYTISSNVSCPLCCYVETDRNFFSFFFPSPSLFVRRLKYDVSVMKRSRDNGFIVGTGLKIFRCLVRE